MGGNGVSGAGRLDPALRVRVEREFDDLMSILDAVLAAPDEQALDELRAAADDLIRAAAAVRLAVDEATQNSQRN